VRTAEALDGLTSFRALNIMVTVLSVLALVVFWVALYRPLIRRLDQDIKDVRRLLLLLPDEVTRSIPSVVAAGRSMLLDSGIAAATTTVTAQLNVTVDATATEDGSGLLQKGHRAGASGTPSDRRPITSYIV
jgi:type II secretory pathway component PulM